MCLTAEETSNGCSLSEQMNSHLVLAIHNKRLVEFVYKNGRPRIVEPHDYGIRKGVEASCLSSKRRQHERNDKWLEDVHCR